MMRVHGSRKCYNFSFLSQAKFHFDFCALSCPEIWSSFSPQSVLLLHKQSPPSLLPNEKLKCISCYSWNPLHRIKETDFSSMNFKYSLYQHYLMLIIKGHIRWAYCINISVFQYCLKEYSHRDSQHMTNTSFTYHFRSSY